jgi:hypothetical protein
VLPLDKVHAQGDVKLAIRQHVSFFRSSNEFYSIWKGRSIPKLAEEQGEDKFVPVLN